MKVLFASCLSIWCMVISLKGAAQDLTVSSPDKQLKVNILVQDGKPMYAVSYKGKTLLENSPLGLTTNEGDFTAGMKYLNKEESAVDKN